MFKRILAILLVALMLICLVGCEGEKTDISATYDFVNDCQLAKSGSNSSNVNIAKCENGYYVAVGKYIYYVDGSLMDSTVLCSKPNCLHDDELCNAYIGANDGIAYNNGYIYTFVDAGLDYEFTGNELKRISADGTEKEICFYTEFTPVDWMMHRGYLYYSVKKYQNIDYAQSTKCDAYIYRIPLDSANPKPEEVYFAEEVDHNANVSELIAFDNYLYFWVGGDLRDNKGREVSKTLCMDLSTFTTKEMLSPNGEELFFPKFLDGKLVFGGGVTDEGYLYYKSDINGENIEPLMEIKKNEQITCDGKYLYVDNALGLTLGVAKGGIDKEDTVRTLSVYDSSLNLIDELCFESKGAYTWNLLPVDENIFLFGGKNSDDKPVIFYFDKSELGTLKGEKWELHYSYKG